MTKYDSVRRLMILYNCCRNLAPTPGGQPQRFRATWAGKENSQQTIAAQTTVDAMDPKIKNITVC